MSPILFWILRVVLAFILVLIPKKEFEHLIMIFNRKQGNKNNNVLVLLRPGIGKNNIKIEWTHTHTHSHPIIC